MSTAARVIAHAKLNLSLRVGAAGPDGLHDIATTFIRIALGDDVVVRLASAGRAVDCRGIDAGPAAQNLALRAADAYAAATGWPAGVAIEIDQLPATPGATWIPVAVVHAASYGTFIASWRTKGAGQLTIRAVLGGSQTSTVASSPPALSVTVYKRSIATLYGPGFWGHKTACGVTLRRRTIGVANRTLPCGTEVEVYYKGSVMTVPVIDRGPYAHHANWDLTMATARALGMTGTAVVGAASVPAAPSSSGSAPSGVPSAQ